MSKGLQFGAGFSFFAYLKHLNVDMLKIDGQFIKNLPADRDNQVFVRAIGDAALNMARDAAGDFVVTWSEQDSGDWNVWAAAYDAGGQPLEDADGTVIGPFMVNTYTTDPLDADTDDGPL